MKDLKELRLEKKLTQQQAANIVGISLRSYKSYENDSEKKNSIKYTYISHMLNECNCIDEAHGLWTIDEIRRICEKAFDGKDVDFCYLFGSYAKGKATEASDIDFLISTKITGLSYFGLIEELRCALRKNLDVLNIEQIKDNYELTVEILRDGVKIYG